MEIQQYFSKKKELYNLLISFIEGKELSNDFENTILFLNEQDIHTEKEELEHFLGLVSSIYNNHHRKEDILSKIQKIILYLVDDIKLLLTCNDLFNIFINDKAIILLLLENKIISSDQIYNFYINTNNKLFISFFYPEIKYYADKEKINQIEREIIEIDPDFNDNYETKRQIGENDSYICSLMRQDSISDFVSHVTRSNTSLSSTIKRSIFETNSFLIEKEPTLIEYATFFGSIQIFQYLRLNDVPLTSSLWLYAIHSNNAEMIHLLEENKISPPNNSYEICLEEAIKCHHNSIANYILDNLIANISDQSKEKMTDWSFRYSNYSFLPEEYGQNDLFFYYCRYGYFHIVDLYIESKKDEINEKISKKVSSLDKISKSTVRSFADENEHAIVYHLLSKQTDIKECYFRACTRMKKIAIPPTIRSIERLAFNGCLSLAQISIPSSVTSIGNNAFYDCTSLKEITVPFSVTSIGSGAFFGCTKLAHVALLSPITAIKNQTFRKCLSLKQINIPSSVTSIEEYAFYECVSLAEVVIPSSVKSIGECSFSYCTKLNNIMISSSVSAIGKKAFFGCKLLNQVFLPSTVLSIGLGAFPTRNIIKI